MKNINSGIMQFRNIKHDYKLKSEANIYRAKLINKSINFTL